MKDGGRPRGGIGIAAYGHDELARWRANRMLVVPAVCHRFALAVTMPVPLAFGLADVVPVVQSLSLAG